MIVVALFVSGALLTGPGAAGVAWSASDPGVPLALAVVAVAVTYLGVGVWAEGLRLLGDTLGTPGLSGLRIGAEAAAHTVLPAFLFLVLAVPVGVVVHGLVPAPAVGAPALVLWLVGLGGLVLGAQWVTAFRSRPPFLSFLPEVGPMVMTLWFARSLLLCAAVGGLLLIGGGGVQITGNNGPGIWLDMQAKLRLGPPLNGTSSDFTINGNAEEGVRVLHMSIVWSNSGTLFGNGVADLTCDGSSLVFGDVTGIAVNKCANTEQGKKK